MIDIKNVSSGYGKNTILNDLSVSFEKGKLTAIIGPNGCGKSTLLKTALGIIPAKCGDIFIDGQNLSRVKRCEISRRISYLSQGHPLSDMTVEETVVHGRFPHLKYPKRYSARDREIARTAMERVGILCLAKKAVSSLSGGMQQIVYIAMALAQDTDYILLDEPNTYLDISHQIELMKLLGSLADSGKGLVAVMHDLPMAFSFSDEIAVMQNGRILRHGSAQQICASGILKTVFGVKMHRENGEYSYILGT